MKPGGWLSAALVILLMLFPPLVGFDPYYLQVFINAFFLASLALAWNLLGGHCGQISFGHAAFFGAGAYVSSLLAMRLGWSPFLTLVVAGLGGLALAPVVGIPCFRLRGPYFALAMLAYAEILRLLVVNLKSLTQGPVGLLSIPSLPTVSVLGWKLDFYADKAPNYYLLLLLVLGQVLVTYLVTSSNLGLALSAIANDEDAASAVGVDALKYKMVALSISGFFTALTGGLYAHYFRFLEPDQAFDVSWSILPIVASLFGGLHSVAGPAVGGVIIWLLDEFLFRGFLTRGHRLIFGALLILVIIFMPQGILGWMQRLQQNLRRPRLAPRTPTPGGPAC